MAYGRETPRALRGAAAVVIATLASLLLIGCEGADQRENELRPPMPMGISVGIEGERVSVSPRAIGVELPEHVATLDGPDPDRVPTDPDRPLPVDLTIANETDEPIRIVLAGPVRLVSGTIPATGTGTMEAELPTGTYEVLVAGAPRMRSASLRVGPLRFSPQNDLALP